VKTGIREAYRRDYDRLKRPRAGTRPRIYVSSVTEPYPPQELTSEGVAEHPAVSGGQRYLNPVGWSAASSIPC
jgi:hypothetical protein